MGKSIIWRCAFAYALSLLFPFALFGAVDYKLPYPGGVMYRVSQGNNADTNGDQKPDSNGTHGLFRINKRNGDPKARYAFDFAMPEGSVVVASAGGIVSFVRDDSKKGGCSRRFQNDANSIVIDHPDNTRTLYLHLQQNSSSVKVGDQVRRGQTLAKSGVTGWICGAHLHFQRQIQGSSWYTRSLPIAFSDVSENEGVPIATHPYTSGNYGDLPTGTLLFSAKRDGNYDIYTINADGTGLTKLTTDSHDDIGFTPNPWSPNGAQIAFSRNDISSPPYWRIYLINSDGGIVVRVTDGISPDWSPDGQKLVFTKCPSNCGIYTIHTDGSGELALYRDGGQYAQWSVLNKIAFELWRAPGDIDVAIINPDGTDLIVIDLTSSGNPQPRWSPDGSKLAFIRHWDDACGYPCHAEIYTVDFDGSNLTKILDLPATLVYIGINPLTWSPEGKQLAFSKNGGLYIVNADGTGLRNLTAETGNPSFGDIFPAWSPDGAHIAFASNRDRRGDDHEIFLINVDGTGLQDLTNSPDSDDLYPFWKPE